MKGILLLLSAIILCSCGPSGNIEEPIIAPSGIIEDCKDLGQGWSIPKAQVVGGGVGKDGIPAIESPQFVNVSDAMGLLDHEIIIGIGVGGEFRGYPHRILEKHEVVNDVVRDRYYSVTFCPLTGTSLTWIRDEDNSFGVSGLLHNSNLITYDRKTDTHWAQMYSLGINGDGICESLENASTIEISWKAWKSRFPDSKILSTETGFNFNYETPARSLNQPEDAVPFFPVYNEDNRLPNYERVLLVVVEDKARAYRLSSFPGGTSILADFLAGRRLTLIGNQDENFIVPYINPVGGSILLTLEDNGMTDVNGNIYNLFGEVVEGPGKGEQLEIPYCMMGYWFAVSAFYPNVDIYQDGEF